MHQKLFVKHSKWFAFDELFNIDSVSFDDSIIEVSSFKSNFNIYNWCSLLLIDDLSECNWFDFFDKKSQHFAKAKGILYLNTNSYLNSLIIGLYISLNQVLENRFLVTAKSRFWMSSNLTSLKKWKKKEV